MSKLEVWNADSGQTAVTITTTGNIYETLLEWLVDEAENDRHWVVLGLNSWAGVPLPPDLDELVTVREVSL